MKNNLGQEPAFPMSDGRDFAPVGMSKRFYAACAAMQGILSSNPEYLHGNISAPIASYAAEYSYQIADELLKQEYMNHCLKTYDSRFFYFLFSFPLKY